MPALAQAPQISILAGNSRLDVGDDGVIKIEAQHEAFRAGLIRADEIRRQSGKLPPISIAFDHKGVFRRQFLRDGLSNSRKRNPRLSDLRTEIVDLFAPPAQALAMPLEHILVIHEDSARTHAEHVLNTMPMPAEVRHRMVVTPTERPACGASSGAKITCAAITSEYFCKAAHAEGSPSPAQAVLEVFFEASPWSEVLAYVRGLQLTHALGMRFGVRLNLVTPAGMVRRGEIVHAELETQVSSELVA
ncbi:MAG TPA: hypothetical protein VL997_06100 [Dyella sp.]|nr:hypothetical protein [Dyella sp.]